MVPRAMLGPTPFNWPSGFAHEVIATANSDDVAYVQALFFLVDVSSRRLEELAALIDAGALTTSVSDVLPLADARTAHEMLAGKPHKRGKIVLRVDGP